MRKKLLKISILALAIFYLAFETGVILSVHRCFECKSYDILLFETQKSKVIDNCCTNVNNSFGCKDEKTNFRTNHKCCEFFTIYFKTFENYFSSEKNPLPIQFTTNILLLINNFYLFEEFQTLKASHFVSYSLPDFSVCSLTSICCFRL